MLLFLCSAFGIYTGFFPVMCLIHLNTIGIYVMVHVQLAGHTSVHFVLAKPSKLDTLLFLFLVLLLFFFYLT